MTYLAAAVFGPFLVWLAWWFASRAIAEARHNRPAAYLAPVTAVARLRHENANLNGLLVLRSAALNRTGTQNDHLRATVAACPSCRNRLEPTT